MEPSEEIRPVVQRWLTTNRDGDADAVFGGISDHLGTLATVRTATSGGTARSSRCGSGSSTSWAVMPVRWGEIEAWEEGTVGWAATKVTIEAPEAEYDARGTYVLHLERGEWKVIQVHRSLPRPNVDVWGAVLPVSLGITTPRTDEQRP